LRRLCSALELIGVLTEQKCTAKTVDLSRACKLQQLQSVRVLHEVCRK
jgi:hypothetical protein